MSTARQRLLTGAFVACLLTGCGTTVPQSLQTAQGGGTGTGADGSGTDASGSTAAGGVGAAPDSDQTALDGGQPAAGTGAASGRGGGSTAVTSDGGRAGATAAGGAPATGQSPAGRAVGALAAKGRGWDEKRVYVGIPTADDANAQFKSLGANFDSGSVRGDIDAIVADINKSGGILGRQLVPVYRDAKSTDYASNAASTAQAMCTYFTQDRPVIAVINGAPQLDGLDTFHRCLERVSVSLVSFTNTDYADTDYQRLGPHLFSAASLSTDLIVPNLISSLKRQGFFTGWDVRSGSASDAPVKVGVLEPDSPQGHHVATLFKSELRKVGLSVASEYFYDPSGSGGKSQSEVLQFQSAGVSHVLNLPPIEAEVLQFQLTAETQRYRPRYGITSFDLPLTVQENAAIVPPAQQVGSMGIGWQPYNDVDAAHDPGDSPGRRACLDTLRRGGQTFSGSQRRAALIAVLFCDALHLVRDAAVASGGFDGDALLAGTSRAGLRLATAGTFRSNLSDRHHGVPGSYRDLQYRKDCSCFTYVGGDRKFTG